jgi:hypothetical protein
MRESPTERTLGVRQQDDVAPDSHGPGAGMSRRELTMRRSPIPLVTCILLLATGLAILGIASSLPNRTESEPTVPAKANADLVRRFYIAANTFLATGNAVP